MPDNAIFYYAAYSLAALVYGGYVVALAFRSRRVREREQRQMQAGVARER